MGTPLAIFCHWRSGSSLLARVLNLCGMETGDAFTFWDASCEPQCEHSVLNTVGNRIHRNEETANDIDKAVEVLIRYKKQAVEKNWDVYGVKFTHILQPRCWEILSPIFKTVWPDAKYIIQVRHPLGIIMSMEKAKAALLEVPESWITADEIVASWISTMDATREIAQAGGIIMLYPDVFLSGKIKAVVRKLGLRWSKKAEVFDKKEFSTYTEYELTKFKRLYPEAQTLFEEIENYV